jgi:hypothetical protein
MINKLTGNITDTLISIHISPFRSSDWSSLLLRNPQGVQFISEHLGIGYFNRSGNMPLVLYRREYTTPVEVDRFVSILCVLNVGDRME